MSRGFNHSEWREAAVQHLLEHGVVDAHHHTLGRAQRKQRNPGLWDWLSESYLLLGSLRGAGLDAHTFLDPDLSDERRLVTLLDALKFTRATTYYRVVDEGLRASFGLELKDLSESNWQAWDEVIRSANQRDDWFAEILVNRMNQRSGVLDRQVGGTLVDAINSIDGREVRNWYDYLIRIRPDRNASEVDGLTKKRSLDGQPSKAAAKIDTLLYGWLRCTREELKDLFGGDPQHIDDFDEYLGYVDSCLERLGSDDDIVALKSAIAGVRSLYFPRRTETAAQKVFTLPLGQVSAADVACFEDFVMDYICERAGELGLPVQFHTGTPFAGVQDDRSEAPALLTGLIARHPDTKFDLMHGGYPYFRECATLAVRFPNVHLNLAWLTMMSDSDARQALHSWLDQVPVNKILWGGDCVFVEETLGAYLVAREQVIAVLGSKIAQAQIGPDEALLCLERIFCDNARQLFSL